MNNEASNDKSTLAGLKVSVDNLTTMVRDYHAEDRDWREAYAGRLRTAENDITALKTILGVWNSINSIGLAIAAWIASKL